MKTPRNPDRLIRTYLQEDQALGQSEVPEHVYGAIRDGIEQTRQRAVIGSMGVPVMNKFLAIGLGAAAVVAVLLIGSNLLGSSSPPPGGEPPASEAPSEAAPSEPPPSAEETFGPLSEGPFILTYEQLFGVRTTVTIPAPDWHGQPTYTNVNKHGMAGPPQGAGLVVYGGDLLVYGDPCEWESTRPDDPAASLDELVAALSAQASRDATPPVDVTVGGHPGKVLTLHVPEDAVFSDCDGGEFRTLIELPSDAAHFHDGPGQIDEVWVVDVDGTLIFFDAGYFAATPAEYVEEMRAMVESATFEVR